MGEYVNTTCCWTIVEPKLINITAQKPAEDVELCYDSNQTYLYNGKLWGCSIPGQDNEHVFISNCFFKMNDNQNKLQCTNSSVKLLSELPCFDSSLELTSSITVTSTSGISNSISLTAVTDKDAIGDTSRSSITPVPSTNFGPCPEDGPWIQTLAGKNATRARGCFKGTVSGQLYNKNVIFIVQKHFLATRRCNADGKWDDPHCNVSMIFSSILSQVYICICIKNECPTDLMFLLLTIYKYMW